MVRCIRSRPDSSNSHPTTVAPATQQTRARALYTPNPPIIPTNPGSWPRGITVTPTRRGAKVLGSNLVKGTFMFFSAISRNTLFLKNLLLLKLLLHSFCPFLLFSFLTFSSLSVPDHLDDSILRARATSNEREVRVYLHLRRQSREHTLSRLGTILD